MKRWLLREIFLRHKLEWGAVCLLFVVMLLVSKSVVVSDSDEELLLNEWILEQKDASVAEQYAFYESKLQEISAIKAKDHLSLADYEQINRMEYAVSRYKLLWDRCAASAAIQDFAMGKEETIWQDQLQPYLLDCPELFQGLPLCRMINNKYINQFLDMQKRNILFVVAIIISVGIWGTYFANGIDRQEAISPNGRRMRIWRHIVLLVICEGVVIFFFVLQIFMSGLFSQMDFWDSSVRVANDLQHSITWMRIDAFLAVSFLLQMANQLIWYLLSYCLLRRCRSVKKAYILTVSICIALYYIGNLLKIYQKDSLLLVGWYDLEQVISDAVPVAGRITTFEVGMSFTIAATIILLLVSGKRFFQRNGT